MVSACNGAIIVNLTKSKVGRDPYGWRSVFLNDAGIKKVIVDLL